MPYTSEDMIGIGREWATGGIKRAQELRDPNSGYNLGVLNQIRQVARSSGPSVNELMQMQRGIGGMSRGSSITMAGEQAKQQQAQARQSSGQSFLSHILNNENNAVANQGQAIGWASNTFQGVNQREMHESELDSQYSFGGFLNQAIGLGGGLLGSYLGRG